MVKDRLNDLKRATTNKKLDNVFVDVETNPRDRNGIKSSFQFAEVLNQWIEKIEHNLENIKQLLRDTDDIRLNRKGIQDNLQDLFNNNTSISRQITGKFKEHEPDLKALNPGSAEYRIKTIQFNTLKTRFKNAFEENTLALEKYKEIQKSIIQGQIKAKGVTVSEEELESLLQGNGNVQLFTENIISETAEAQRQLADLEERHQQLLKIERMLVEIRDLFVEMAILVDDQQELLDRVEFQAQQATEYVGGVDLKSVRKSKKKYLKRKIYCVIAILLVLLIVIILLIK